MESPGSFILAIILYCIGAGFDYNTTRQLEEYEGVKELGPLVRKWGGKWIAVSSLMVLVACSVWHYVWKEEFYSFLILLGLFGAHLFAAYNNERRLADIER